MKMKKLLSAMMAVTLALTCSITAFASATGNVDVTGHIGTSGNPTIDPGGDPTNPGTDPGTGGTYDVTFSSSVHWWVTQTSYPNVVNGDAAGANASVVNAIQNNNSAADVNVSFDSFVGDSAANTVDPDLTLFLTDDLAADGVGSIDLSGDYTGSSIAYTAPLQNGTSWTFGFSGQYTPATGNVNTSYTPAYTMTLGFSF